MEKQAKPRVETPVSAGGVVYRQVDGRIETVLCGRVVPAGTGGVGEEGRQISGDALREDIRWSLAKGTPDQGETLEETAVREVQEETGLLVQLESPIDSIDYWFADRGASVRYHKTVHFYLMVPVGGDTTLHDPEFDVVRWFPLEEALNVLAYPNEARLLRQAQKLICKHGEDG
jgi:8-oxo-dGTP pyrophosphatase MutT (NUDIX family)